MWGGGEHGGGLAQGNQSGGARGTLLTRHRLASVLGSRDAGHDRGPRKWEKLLEKLDRAQGNQRRAS